MTNEERELLVQTARTVSELEKDRNDLLIGVAAVLLDLYRASFDSGSDTKPAALTRLRLQHQQLAQATPPVDCLSLKWLIDSLEDEKLDAAKLFRMRPAGSA